ncbi:MAG: hypothetical protein RL322_2872 [Pseudomonadota bacterium]|jgi:general secretion pathway protein N
MRGGPLFRGVLGVVLAALLSIAAGLVLAPARWLDLALNRATQGQIRLAEANGTLWRGAGRLVFAGAAGFDAGEAVSSATTSPVLRGVALPGQLRWRVDWAPLLVGLVDAELILEGMKAPVRLQGRATDLRLGDGQLALARTDLGALGSPWSTVRPAGAVRLRWEGLSLQAGLFFGRVQIELHELSSALSAVRPLGTYRIALDGQAGRTTVTLGTMSGPLELSGRGEIDRGRLRFEAKAAPADPQDSRLTGLLNLLGQREGSQTIIRIGK